MVAASNTRPVIYGLLFRTLKRAYLYYFIELAANSGEN
jgi:hypothetical protein